MLLETMDKDDSDHSRNDLSLAATKMFLDREREKETQRKDRRRASLTSMPLVDDDDDLMQQSMRSLRSTARRASVGNDQFLGPQSSQARSRRASLKGDSIAVPTMPDEGDGYGTDSEAAKPSKRAQARRASLSLKEQAQFEGSNGRRRASMSEAIPSYDLDGSRHDEVYEAERQATSRSRRASMSGGMPRRGSNAGGTTKLRRGSNGGAVPRRGSNGASMPRRGSNGVPMDPHGRMSRRASNRYQEERPPRRGSNEGAPMERGVMRIHTADSVTMAPMCSSSGRRRSSAAGINPDALARMNRRMSGTGGAMQDDDDIDYDYEVAGNGMGYGFGPPVGSPPVPGAFERRGSNRSQASSSSRSSRRRNSYLVRKPSQDMDGMSVEPRVSDSDLDSSDDDKGMYGYYASNQSFATGMDDGNDSGSEHSENSFSSSKRSRRRNSCLIRNGQDPMVVLLMENHSRMSDRDLLASAENEDYNDPDSLLNRSGYLKAATAYLHKDKGDCLDSESSHEDEEPEVLPPPEAPPVSPPRAPKSPVRSPAAVVVASMSTGLARRQSWGRSTPFTTPHEPLTKESLAATEMYLTTSTIPAAAAGEVKIPGYSIRNNWGEMGFESVSSDESDSDESFGASMYEHAQSCIEIDRYKQRARRRNSLEKTWIDIDSLVAAQKNGNAKKRLPTFKPASNCSNASDFVVRAFCARLRAGITVVKHNRSRWSKSQMRILYLLPDGKTLSWKNVEKEDKGSKARRPKLDLTKCQEVRHAWSPDPEKRKSLGTSIMRKRCKDGTANKSFALIFAKRTLDMTALSSDQCKVLMEGFSALCFRLQMDRCEADNDSSDDNMGNTTSRSYLTDDDWASTVYGGESTVSMTQSNTTNNVPLTVTPWGL